MFCQPVTGRPLYRPTSPIPPGIALQDLPSVHEVLLFPFTVRARHVHVLYPGQCVDVGETLKVGEAECDCGDGEV